MRLLVVVLVCLPMAAIGAGAEEPANAEAAAHCAYVTEQAAAQRSLLQSPSGYVTISQPDTGLPLEAVTGARESLSNVRKGNITMEVARSGCALYAAQSDAQKKLNFALPQISKDVLQHRLQLIDQAVTQLDTMIADNLRRVVAQNMTRPAVYSLQSAKLRLIAERTATLTGITSPFVPQLPPEPLKLLIEEKRTADLANQHALNRLQKQNTWDVSLSVGAYHQLGASQVPGTSPNGAYGAVEITYSFGAHGVDRGLDRSVGAYEKWQKAELTDVSFQAEVLRLEILDTIHIQKAQLAALQEQAREIDGNISSLNGLDTDAAINFRNQLLADQIVLNVDLNDVAFRVDQLQDFLRINY